MLDLVVRHAAQPGILRGASDLYEKYTQIYLHRDWAKGKSRRRLSIELRGLFAEAIALTMLRTGRLAVEYSEIKELVASGRWAELSRLRQQLSLSAEELAGDVQVSMFLSRTKDTFEFAHKSFMEFFVARRIVKDLAKDARPAIRASLSTILPKEVLYFVGNCCAYSVVTLEKVKHAFRDMRGDIIAQRNLGGIILNSGREVPSVYFHDVDLFEIGSGGATWRKLSFVDTKLRRMSVVNTMLSECTLRGCNVHDCTWQDCRIEKCTIDIEGGALRFRDVEISDSHMKIYGHGVVFERGRMWGGTLELGAGVRFVGYKLVGCRVRPIHEGSGVRGFQSCEFRRCRLAGVGVLL